ncbi:TRAP transporter small permease subunit [Pusillimonas sp. TS35]|uniref:TRAP transporter small permease n=1 Tax=Paracandidimonas lactea TaxID=2895524 RepID=UPI00136C6254|nr:TRAP transporter small permease [Paracandidimonas lactea]MYN14663.1 TRAP transporter small permease subunit [Pusillimonas sp. TS35]
MKPRWHERLEEWLLATLLAVMTLITFAQVVARYVFNYSYVWALELATFIFGGLIFLGISYGVRVSAHIGVDALVKLLPPRTARAVAIVATLLCLVYALIVFYGGWVYVSKMYDIGILAQDIPIPQWVPRLVMPVGFALLLLRLLGILRDLLRGKRSRLLGDEAEEALKHRTDIPADGEQP